MLSCNTLISSLFTLTSFLLASSFLSLQFSAQFSNSILVLSTIHPLRTLLGIILLLKYIYINVTFVWLHHNAEIHELAARWPAQVKLLLILPRQRVLNAKFALSLKGSLGDLPRNRCAQIHSFTNNRTGGSQHRNLGHQQFLEGRRWCQSLGVLLGFGFCFGVFFQFHGCMCVLFSSHLHRYKCTRTHKKAKPDPIF